MHFPIIVGDKYATDDQAVRMSPLKEVTMLVLSRKLNEKIVINHDIVITIVKIDRNQVRIGIQAPGEIPVYREEIIPLAQAAALREEMAVMA